MPFANLYGKLIQCNSTPSVALQSNPLPLCRRWPCFPLEAARFGVAVCAGLVVNFASDRGVVMMAGDVVSPTARRVFISQDVRWVSDVSSVKDNSWLADSSSSLLWPFAQVRTWRTRISA